MFLVTDKDALAALLEGQHLYNVTFLLEFDIIIFIYMSYRKFAIVYH